MMLPKNYVSLLTLVMARSFVIVVFEVPNVFAFSPPGASTPNKVTSTERSYGHHVDSEIAAAFTSPILLVKISDMTLEREIAEEAHLARFSQNKIIAAKKARTKRNRYDRMLRPRSLNSKIETSAAGTKKSKRRPELLTREEESQLTYSIRELRRVVRLRDYLVANHPKRQDTELPWQPNENEWAQACGISMIRLRQVMNEGHEARAKLVDSNGGLVCGIAKKHYYAVKHANQAGGGVGSILTMQDLVQEGNLGLMEAAERFEPERGLKFSTYATYWVRQRILRSISESSRIIRLPAHVHTMVRKIYKAKKQMEREIGRTPSSPELAHYLEMSVEKLQSYTDSSRTVLSLELPMNVGDFKGEDKRTLGDKIASDSPTPEEDAEADSLRRDIRQVVDELPSRERDVLVTRFGLDDGNSMTVEETSKRLGISRDRVRLVEAKALNKLRHPQRNYRLKNYVGGTPEAEEEYEEEVAMSPERIWSF